MLNISTGCLILASIFLSFSMNSNGEISLTEKTQARKVEPDTRKGYTAICPDGKTAIWVCGVGQSTCSPFGICP